MKYTIGCMMLGGIMGVILLADSPPSNQAASQPAPIKPSGKWYAYRSIYLMTVDGMEWVPEGAEVEKISETAVRYNDRTFGITPGDIVNNSQRKALEDEAARREEIEQRIIQLDRHIAQVSMRIERETRNETESIKAGRITSRRITINRLEENLAALQAERYHLATQGR